MGFGPQPRFVFPLQKTQLLCIGEGGFRQISVFIWSYIQQQKKTTKSITKKGWNWNWYNSSLCVCTNTKKIKVYDLSKIYSHSKWGIVNRWILPSGVCLSLYFIHPLWWSQGFNYFVSRWNQSGGLVWTPMLQPE